MEPAPGKSVYIKMSCSEKKVEETCLHRSVDMRVVQYSHCWRIECLSEPESEPEPEPESESESRFLAMYMRKHIKGIWFR